LTDIRARQEYIRHFLNLLSFAQDDVSLTLDSRGLKLRVLQNIGEDIDSLGHIGVEGLGVVNGVFPLDNTIRIREEKKLNLSGTPDRHTEV
jgi:hypothetical protein